MSPFNFFKQEANTLEKRVYGIDLIKLFVNKHIVAFITISFILSVITLFLVSYLFIGPVESGTYYNHILG